MMKHSIIYGYSRYIIGISYWQLLCRLLQTFSLLCQQLWGFCCIFLIFFIILITATAVGTGGEKFGGINVHILLPQLAQFAIEKYQEQQDRDLGEYHDGHGQECSFVDSLIRCTNWGRKESVGVCGRGGEWKVYHCRGLLQHYLTIKWSNDSENTCWSWC